MHICMKDREIFASFTAYVKATGQSIDNGYPYVKGDELVFESGKFSLCKKGDLFAIFLAGIPMIGYSDGDSFVSKCNQLALSCHGLSEDEMDIPQ